MITSQLSVVLSNHKTILISKMLKGGGDKQQQITRTQDKQQQIIGTM